MYRQAPSIAHTDMPPRATEQGLPIRPLRPSGRHVRPYATAGDKPLIITYIRANEHNSSSLMDVEASRSCTWKPGDPVLGSQAILYMEGRRSCTWKAGDPVFGRQAILYMEAGRSCTWKPHYPGQRTVYPAKKTDYHPLPIT
jgi:hypothetical protein